MLLIWEELMRYEYCGVEKTALWHKEENFAKSLEPAYVWRHLIFSFY
jgi:hypothetical protein